MRDGCETVAGAHEARPRGVAAFDWLLACHHLDTVLTDLNRCSGPGRVLRWATYDLGEHADRAVALGEVVVEEVGRGAEPILGILVSADGRVVIEPVGSGMSDRRSEVVDASAYDEARWRAVVEPAFGPLPS